MLSITYFSVSTLLSGIFCTGFLKYHTAKVSTCTGVPTNFAPLFFQEPTVQRPNLLIIFIYRKYNGLFPLEETIEQKSEVSPDNKQKTKQGPGRPRLKKQIDPPTDDNIKPSLPIIDESNIKDLPIQDTAVEMFSDQKVRFVQKYRIP